LLHATSYPWSLIPHNILYYQDLHWKCTLPLEIYYDFSISLNLVKKIAKCIRVPLDIFCFLKGIFQVLDFKCFNYILFIHFHNRLFLYPFLRSRSKLLIFLIGEWIHKLYSKTYFWIFLWFNLLEWCFLKEFKLLSRYLEWYPLAFRRLFELCQPFCPIK